MKKYIPYIVIAFLVPIVIFLFIGYFSEKGGSEEPKVSVVRDTIVVKDTIRVPKPIPYKVKEIDTIFIEVDSLKKDTLVFREKEYRDSNYVAYVSGYDANLDSISIFRKENTIFVTETRTEYVRKNQIFLDAGVNYSIAGDVMPYVGATFVEKRGIMIGAEIGYGTLGAFGGFRIGYKLN